MSKETLAIVSSYDELCGNASYTRALEKELSKHFEVTVLSLDVDLLRKEKNKKANQHIQDLIQKLKKFDCVNIQFEAGLFGSSIFYMRRNFFALAKASKRLVVTMHRYQSSERYPGLLNLGKSILLRRLRSFLNRWGLVFANNRYVPFYHEVIRFCQKRQIPIIVHTKRDRKSIELEFDYDKVFDHPLCFHDQNEIQTIKQNYTKENFYRDFKLEKDKIYIGLFGFINKYKGHDTAIKALAFLPGHYELLICGAQHPHTIQREEEINPYIKQLLKGIQKLGLGKRVKFYRLSKDEDFIKALMHCDYNILPYLEVTQGGSAIAALTLESNSRSLFSQNFAFFELDKYAPNSFSMFSIGNYMELANAILSFNPSAYTDNLKAYHERYNIHTSAHLYQKLLTRNFCNNPVANESREEAQIVLNT
jgi:glycosyltransferase involved in cell wall biosynthesis